MLFLDMNKDRNLIAFRHELSKLRDLSLTPELDTCEYEIFRHSGRPKRFVAHERGAAGINRYYRQLGI